MSDDPLTITLPGDPHGKGRPRFSRLSGTAYTPHQTRNYEAALRLAASEAMGKTALFLGPLYVTMDAEMGIPMSWSHTKRGRALDGELQPVVRPDLDNLVKNLDALNGIIWHDDAQIVRLDVQKRYSLKPCLTIKVRAA